jgi:hypothetical protein
MRPSGVLIRIIVGNCIFHRCAGVTAARYEHAAPPLSRGETIIFWSAYRTQPTCRRRRRFHAGAPALSILRQLAAEHQDGQAEYPAREQVDDLEQHPAS